MSLTTCRIASKFSQFRQEKKFFDIKIKSAKSNQIFPCHKILLARTSQYFRDLFNQKSSLSTNFMDQPYHLPFDPNGLFEKALDFIYDGEIMINKNNICEILAISEYYKISSLSSHSRDCFIKMINKDNVLRLCKQCLEYNDLRDADLLVQTIADNFIDFDAYQKKELYNSINAYILAHVLDPSLESPLKSISDDQKFTFIDYYNSIHPITNPIEKEELSKIFDWNKDEESIQWIIHHDCKWLPAKRTRSFYRDILRLRRKNVLQYRDSTKEYTTESHSQEKSSRWYSFAWITQISNCSEFDQNNQNNTNGISMNIISFMQTFGGLVKSTNNKTSFWFMDVHGYGTISEKNGREGGVLGPETVCNKNPNDYFLAHSETRNPGFCVQFGNGTKILLQSIIIQLHSTLEMDLKKIKLNNAQIEVSDSDWNFILPHPQKLLFSPYAGGKKIGENYQIEYENSHQLIDSVDFLRCDLDQSKQKQYFDGFELTMNDKNSAGSYSLKISDIEIVGEFAP